MEILSLAWSWILIVIKFPFTKVYEMFENHFRKKLMLDLREREIELDRREMELNYRAKELDLAKREILLTHREFDSAVKRAYDI